MLKVTLFTFLLSLMSPTMVFSLVPKDSNIPKDEIEKAKLNDVDVGRKIVEYAITVCEKDLDKKSIKRIGYIHDPKNPKPFNDKNFENFYKSFCRQEAEKKLTEYMQLKIKRNRDLITASALSASCDKAVGTDNSPIGPILSPLCDKAAEKICAETKARVSELEAELASYKSRAIPAAPAPLDTHSISPVKTTSPMEQFLSAKSKVDFIYSKKPPRGFSNDADGIRLFEQMRALSAQLPPSTQQPESLEYEYSPASDFKQVLEKLSLYSNEEIYTILNMMVKGLDSDLAGVEVSDSRVQNLQQLKTLLNGVKAKTDNSKLEQAETRFNDQAAEWKRVLADISSINIKKIFNLLNSRQVNPNDDELLAQFRKPTTKSDTVGSMPRHVVGGQKMAEPTDIFNAFSNMQARKKELNSITDNKSVQAGSGSSSSVVDHSRINSSAKAIISDYTINGFSNINKALRKTPLSRKDTNYVNHLKNALNAISPFTSTVFRGDNIADIPGFEERVGATLSVPSFWSTSKDKAEGEKFYRVVATKKDSKPRLFIINSKNGKDITNLSARPKEQEVLFKTNSKFTISKIDGDNIYLDEVVDSPSSTASAASAKKESYTDLVVADLAATTDVNVASQTLLSDTLPNNTKELLDEVISAMKDDLFGLNEKCSPSQLAEVAMLRNAVADKLIIYSKHDGMDSIEREFITSSEYNKFLSNPSNMLCILALDVLAQAKTAPGSESAKQLMSVGETTLGKMLYHGLSKNPQFLEAQPLNKRMSGKETSQDVLNSYLAQKNISKSFVPVVNAARSAYVSYLNKKAVVSTNATPYKSTSWTDGTYQNRYTSILNKIKNMPINTLIQNRTGANEINMTVGLKAGFSKLADKMKVNPSSITYETFLKEITKSPWILSSDVAHLLLDRAHLFTALKKDRAIKITFQNKEVTFKELFDDIISDLTRNPSKEKNLIAEQMFIRLQVMDDYINGIDQNALAEKSIIKKVPVKPAQKWILKDGHNGRYTKK
ncbi:MAG: hypothetical protein HQK51_06095 [Oligoflexia bacterium]|nr:hypothetical protein [Oligoflexia bacterium]